jgi:hyperosmotically inducible periplasmic protein
LIWFYFINWHPFCGYLVTLDYPVPLIIHFYLKRKPAMSLYKSLSRFTAIALIGCGSVSAVYAATEAAAPPSESSAAGAYVNDSAITAKVKAALISSKLTGISVTTQLGVVSLSGSVASDEVRQQATKIASSTEGVRGVDYAGLSVKSGS